MVQSSQGFQNQINVQPAPAVEGDWASVNPYFSAIAGPGGFVAGANGVRIGRFCWLSSTQIDTDGTSAIVTNVGQQNAGGPVVGFVGRAQQGLNTTYLAEAGMVIPAGFPVTVFSGGDFWVKNSGTGQAQPGQTAYASYVDGSINFAAAATPSTGTCSGSCGPVTAAWTGAINGNVLTVSAVASGTLVNGMTVLGTGGGGVAASTAISGQLSGAVGGTGTYSLNISEQTVLSTAMTGSIGLLTVTGTGVTGLGIGATITGVAAGTIITQLGTGTGGAGTYFISPPQTFGATNLTFALNVATKWVAQSAGLAGELVKISDHLLG